ncbi:MAG: phosphotransferase family protein [Devosia sp.]
MPVSPFSLDTLRAIIIDKFPEHAGAQFTLLSEGWDSVAVDIDGRLIFKFPRHERGEAALRREAAILGTVGATVTLPVPKLVLFDTPRIFSRHEKLPGDHLLPAQYDALDELARQALGEALGQFYAELHTIEPAQAIAAGVQPADAWLDADEILRCAVPVLPEALRPFAEHAMAAWRNLEPDPYGDVYGYFDGHGWNMAFDHANNCLNGIYDFADSGIGPLHREFVYSSLVSPDLTPRIIASYERHSGRVLDRKRIDVLTATHWLWELAAGADMPEVDAMLAHLLFWHGRR